MNPELFYDNFTKKLLTDYMTNNHRMASAITMVLNNISPDSKKILDLGCGIGWSTHEIARFFPQSQVEGVDLSTNSIKVADTLFKLNNNGFSKSDVTKESFGNNNIYDAIVMIDVLEHIPLDERKQFIESINNILSDNNGRFIVSCPTIYHQNYLRNENPGGLQPVDEDITISVLNEIAKQLNGDVIYFTYTSIWNTNDYLYAVIEKNVRYKPYNNKSIKSVQLESINERINRVSNSTYKGLFSDDELKSFEITTYSLKDKMKRLFK